MSDMYESKHEANASVNNDSIDDRPSESDQTTPDLSAA